MDRDRRRRRSVRGLGVRVGLAVVTGGLVAGAGADALGFSGAIAVVAGLTAASGLWVAFDLRDGEGRARETRPAMHGEQLLAGASGPDSGSPLDG